MAGDGSGDLRYCDPARPAPAKQIDFDGVGTFKNLHDLPDDFECDEEPVRGESLHYFEVHFEDLGEPGSHPEPADICPPEGSNCSPGDCVCPDFYHFTLYCGPDSASGVMYEEFGYIHGGNQQIHPPIEGDHNCTGHAGHGSASRFGAANEAFDDNSSDASEGTDDPTASFGPSAGCGVFGMAALLLMIAALVGLRLGRSRPSGMLKR